MAKIIDIRRAQAARNRTAVGKYRAGRFKLDDRLPLNTSSVIAAIDYDGERSELDITFTSQKKYRYFDVPPEVYHDFLVAPSKGEFFNARIKDRYEYSEVQRRR